MDKYINWFNELGMADIDLVGGKNASLGEMISNLSQSGVQVPNGFAVNVEAFKLFITENNIGQLIQDELNGINVDDSSSLSSGSQNIKQLFLNGEVPTAVVAEIESNLKKLQSSSNQQSFAVRSSATTEDLIDASFAGQQETRLNIVGNDNIIIAVKEVYASLYTERAISYREHQGFCHSEALLSIGIQEMVRSDLAQSGVMFTIDTESGFDKVVFLTSTFGLGETIVQGSVNPDEFYIHKDLLRSGKPAVTVAVRAWSWLSGSGLELDVRCELAQAVRAVGAVPITSWLSGPGAGCPARFWSWLSVARSR